MKPLEEVLDVLIVEDEELLAKATAASLRDRGHIVTVVGSALEAMQVPLPDVVVTDVHLPMVSGVELFELLQLRDPDVRVIITSGSFAGLDIESLLQRGVRRVLAKPFAFHELIEAVEAAAAPSSISNLERPA